MNKKNIKKLDIFLLALTILIFVFIIFFCIFNWHLVIDLLNVIITGIISGLTNGYIYKLGFTAGGINTIAPIINKYKNIRVGTINLIINIIILLIGCLQFGIKKLLYAIVVIIINSILINLVMYGKFLKRK